MTDGCAPVSVESAPSHREGRRGSSSGRPPRYKIAHARRPMSIWRAHPDLSSQGGQRVDIVVKGRNVEVPDHYRQHVADKLRKVERYDQKIMSVDVELFHERNRRQSDNCQRVEITCFSRGPVVRAEATAGDFYSALDCAITKLDSRLRRAADRRRIHRGRHAPVSVAAATAALARPPATVGAGAATTATGATAWSTDEPSNYESH